MSFFFGDQYEFFCWFFSLNFFLRYDFFDAKGSSSYTHIVMFPMPIFLNRVYIDIYDLTHSF